MYSQHGHRAIAGGNAAKVTGEADSPRPARAAALWGEGVEERRCCTACRWGWQCKAGAAVSNHVQGTALNPHESPRSTSSAGIEVVLGSACTSRATQEANELLITIIAQR
jgi:hypothetical protein